ncbi:hypothetical protein ACIQUQ_21445 [Streptomyces sp. NPDC101118]|uniref:hypothetical protein n=1 Tax=Streptomyces sp. NPDC101118 TaxID=3366109 RepID=UPI0038283D67
MPHPRTTRTGTGLRLLRAAVFTAVCVVLSGAGHALASCATVPLWALCAGFLAVFACAAPLAGRRRSLPGIAGALAGGQLALHALFGLGQHRAVPQPVPSPDESLAALAARLVCGGNTVPLSPAEARQVLLVAGIDPATAGGHLHTHAGGAAEAVAPVLAPDTGLFSLPMLLGHLLAALAAGWLLGRGDAALLRLVRLSAEAGSVRSLRAALAFVRALRRGLPGAEVRTAELPRGEEARRVPVGREALQHTVIRRGPPAAYALAA